MTDPLDLKPNVLTTTLLSPPHFQGESFYDLLKKVSSILIKGRHLETDRHCVSVFTVRIIRDILPLALKNIF